MSHDEKSITAPRRFLIDVEETIRVVLEQEDTDGDFQISVTDAGPKLIPLGTATSNGFKSFDIRVRVSIVRLYAGTIQHSYNRRVTICCPTYCKNWPWPETTAVSG